MSTVFVAGGTCFYSTLPSLIQTVLASVEDSSAWFTAIRFQPDFVDNLSFILHNSTNAHLLIATIRLLDAITRGDDSLAEVWCGSDLLDAILVAQHQMKWLHGTEVEIIHRLWYTFSSTVSGCGALIKCFDRLLPTFGVYLRKVCEDEPHLLPLSACHNSLRAIIPVLDSVVASVPAQSAITSFFSYPTILPCLIRIALGCQQQLQDYPLSRGILSDLQTFFKDLLAAVEATLKTSISASDSLDTLDVSLNDYRWLLDLESDHRASEREAFSSCCISDGSTDTRNQLLFICNKLKLVKLLETLTDVF